MRGVRGGNLITMLGNGPGYGICLRTLGVSGRRRLARHVRVPCIYPEQPSTDAGIKMLLQLGYRMVRAVIDASIGPGAEPGRKDHPLSLGIRSWMDQGRA